MQRYAPPHLDQASIEKLKALPNNSEREIALTRFLLGMFFSSEWFERHVSPKPGKPRFIGYHTSKENEGDVRRRLQILAEEMFNLLWAGIPGFKGAIDLLRQNPTEGRVSEIGLAASMHKSGIPFSFHRKPNSVPGEKNHDFDIEMPNKLIVPAEAHCRRFDTKFKLESTAGQLRQEASQLPSDRPGFVIVEVPHEWVKTPVEELQKAIDAVYRNYSRVASVKLFSRIPDELPHLTIIRFIWQESFNPHTDWGKQQDWTIWGRFKPDVEWMTIPNAVHYYLSDGQERLYKYRRDQQPQTEPDK